MSDICGAPLLEMLQTAQTATNLIVAVASGTLACSSYCPKDDEEGRQKLKKIANGALLGRKHFRDRQNRLF